MHLDIPVNDIGNLKDEPGSTQALHLMVVLLHMLLPGLNTAEQEFPLSKEMNPGKCGLTDLKMLPPEGDGTITEG
jgi:hypothetical protein